MCPPGLVADGKGGCVAEEDCPCVHNEATYKPGETVRVGCNTWWVLGPSEAVWERDCPERHWPELALAWQDLSRVLKVLTGSLSVEEGQGLRPEVTGCMPTQGPPLPHVHLGLGQGGTLAQG